MKSMNYKILYIDPISDVEKKEHYMHKKSEKFIN